MLSAILALLAAATFKDVPAGHWAEPAVAMMAVDHGYMHAFPDGGFHGEKPLTRGELAEAVWQLVLQLEAETHASWRAEKPVAAAFMDLPADAPYGEAAKRLARDYGLFDGVPGLTPRAFAPATPVTRYELAHVLRVLIRHGEEHGVVDMAGKPTRMHVFADLPNDAWDYDDVRALADRYQVLEGFPDGTYRGPEAMSRYQFAATAALAFPRVRGLASETAALEARRAATLRAPVQRYLEFTPYWGGLALPLGTSRPGLAGRAAGYAGTFMGLAELELLAPGSRNEAAANAGLALAPLPGLGLTPMLGARVVNLPSTTLGGLDYGVLAYYRTTPDWAGYGRVRGTATMGSTSGGALGVALGEADLGLEWNWSPRLLVSLEAGYAWTASDAGGSVGAVPAPRLAVGVGYGI